MRKKRYDAVMFDMDNTLLRSKIDFRAMKTSVFELLVEAGVCAGHFPVHEHTIATLLNAVRQKERFTAKVERRVWETVATGELAGMEGALLEEGVTDMLAEVRGRFALAVLTNNAREAAVAALERTGIAIYFDYIAGREQVEALKPSPSGVRHVMARYPDIPAERWLYVGDSWIDGRAAADGGIAFLACNASGPDLERRGVRPIGQIRAMSELVDYLFD